MPSIPDTLLPTSIQRAEVVATHYQRTAPPGTTIDHLMDPDYWVHVAVRGRTNSLRPGDMITVIAADGSFDVDLRVQAVDPRGLWAQMRLLRVDDTPNLPAEERAGDGYLIEFAGPHKFRILDRQGNIVEKGIPSRTAAMAKLAEIRAEKLAPPAQNAA